MYVQRLRKYNSFDHFEIPCKGRFWIALGRVLWAKWLVPKFQIFEDNIFSTFSLNCNFSRTARCISSKFINNFLCDIDNMCVNFHEDRTIIFWDFWYLKFLYFTRSFSLSHDSYHELEKTNIDTVMIKFCEDLEFIYL